MDGGRQYVASNISSPFSAGAALHTVLELATGSAVEIAIFAIDITFNGTDATVASVKVDLCRVANTCTGASSPPVPSPLRGGGLAAAATLKWNATAEGASAPAAIEGWYIPPTSGVVQQLPLGRPIIVPVSAFLALRTTPAATVTVIANIYFDE